jgi:hypothetical protein
MSDGYIFQRGPQGQVPNGQSINGQNGAFGNIPLNGNPVEHVTMHGDGWHRSWDNNYPGGPPGISRDHSTIHATGQKIQHPH